MSILSPSLPELAPWQQVPDRVSALLPQALAAKCAHDRAIEASGLLPFSAASWAPGTGIITVHVDNLPTARQQRTYEQKIGSAYGVNFSAELPDPETAVVIKKAAWFPSVGNAWEYSNKAFGGPSPLSNAIVSGLLLGGLGYGAGTLAEQLFPETFLERGRLRKPLGIIGALGGLGIGAMNASATHRTLPENGYWKAWVTKNDTPVPPDRVPLPKQASDFTFNGSYTPTGISKPYIPVDAFNRATWADASKNYDQYDYVNHTSPQIAAATTGILSGIKQQTGSSIISPSTVIKGLASAGVGLATATLAGKTIGALAGLTPAAQESVQNMGLWGGMLHAVIPPALGWR